MKIRVFVFWHRSCVEERNAQMSKLTFGLCNASCRYHLYNAAQSLEALGGMRIPMKDLGPDMWRRLEPAAEMDPVIYHQAMPEVQAN